MSVDYSEKLKRLRGLLDKIKSMEGSLEEIDDISDELSNLENSINSSYGISSNEFSGYISDDGEMMSARLDSTVTLYSQSYDRTKKILLEKESKLDGEVLLTEEELDAIRREYSEKLLEENAYSIFLRNMIELERQVIKKHEKENNSVKSPVNDDSFNYDLPNSLGVNDIDLIYFSEPLILGGSYKNFSLSNQEIASIKMSSSLMPEKVVSIKPTANYIPKSAPVDMVDTIVANSSEPTNIFCFKNFSDELMDGKYSYNVLHATSGEYMNINSLLSTMTSYESDSYSEVDKMLDDLGEYQFTSDDHLTKGFK